MKPIVTTHSHVFIPITSGSYDYQGTIYKVRIERPWVSPLGPGVGVQHEKARAGLLRQVLGFVLF